MSCQGFCKAHQPVANQEFDFSYFENSPCQFWPCDSEERYLGMPGNAFSDPFDTTTYPTSTWVGPEINDFLTFPTEARNDLTPDQSQSIKEPSVATEPPITDTEISQRVTNLEDEVEKLKKLVENLQNELIAENAKLCSEVEENVEKVKDWTAELWQRVLSLVGERKMN